MTNQVPWNKIILEEFINLALLTKDEEMILRTRIYGWAVREQADRLNMSVSSVNRIIKKIKNKYDTVEKYSAVLPPRKSSEKETFLDDNLEVEKPLFFDIYLTLTWKQTETAYEYN